MMIQSALVLLLLFIVGIVSGSTTVHAESNAIVEDAEARELFGRPVQPVNRPVQPIQPPPPPPPPTPRPVVPRPPPTASPTRYNQGLGKGCNAPYGYCTSERDRLVRCKGEGSIDVITYDSALRFIDQSLTAVQDLTEQEWSPACNAFHFYPDSRGPDDCSVDPTLCDFLQCEAGNSGGVGLFFDRSISNPAYFPRQAVNALCKGCGVAYKGEMCLPGTTGGAASSSGMRVYCTTNGVSTQLLSVGGGGGGGAGPSANLAVGGGAEIRLPEVSACQAGSCGGDTPDYTGRGCPLKQRFTTSNINRGNVCSDSAYETGVSRLRRAIETCLATPGSDISLSAGGGAGGGVIKRGSSEYQFSTGFTFDMGPISDKSNSWNSVTREACSLAYANALCKNARYSDYPDSSYELCLCPVRNLYDPPTYNGKCSYGDSPASNSNLEVVTSSLVQQNCRSWCPEGGEVTIRGPNGNGIYCKNLLPACACKEP